MAQPQPPKPEFLMFYIRQDDGTRARGTYLNASKALLDAWQAQNDNEKKGVLCIVRENGDEIRRVIDQDNHVLTDTPAP